MVVSKQSPFVRSALLSGQVSQAQIDAAIDRVREAGGLSALPAVEVGDERMADELTEMGILTPYQASQLRQGNTRLNLGPYVIVDFLGQGGMGQVFVALHQMMERRVAIKVLPQSKSNSDSIANFKREIQTQAKLDHRNLVRAYDAGHDGNVYFLVTEYVPGTDLRRLVRSRGPLTMKQAASVITQAALGIEYAHSQGLIHRDVKPGNLLVTPEGLVKVSDLGLAGFLNEGQDDPRAGKIVGTADYLAPEKITTPLDVAPVSDIYSLGCTLYYAVTGKVPFPGGTTRDKARRHCEETPWHPRKFNPEISDEFVDLIADMMEKDPSQRLPTAGDVVQRLEPWADTATPLPHPALTKSPWQPPPLPSGREETVDDFGELAPDAASGTTVGDQTSSEELSGASQSTDGMSAHDTISPNERLVVPLPPPAPVHGSEQITAAVSKALAIAIPLSLLAGGLITFVFLELLK